VFPLMDGCDLGSSFWKRKGLEFKEFFRSLFLFKIISSNLDFFLVISSNYILKKKLKFFNLKLFF